MKVDKTNKKKYDKFFLLVYLIFRMNSKVVIITDLDGSLLHPENYSFDEAIPALNLINEKNIPLVISSSKTKTEIESYRERLDNNEPFVTENGGGIFVPKNYFDFKIDGYQKDDYIVIKIGTPYSKIREIFNEIKINLNINAIGFGDMTVDEISEVTGMTNRESNLSKNRDFDEPFLFKGTEIEKDKLLKAIEEQGYCWTKGSFLHILGNHDKGKAVRTIMGFYNKMFENIISIGIGDSLNDVSLLKEVDYPILIPKKNGSYVVSDDQIPNVIKAEKFGSAGWNDSVIEILRRI